MSLALSLDRALVRARAARAAGRLPGLWYGKMLLHTVTMPLATTVALARCLGLLAAHRWRGKRGRVHFLGRTRRFGDLIALEPLSRQLAEDDPEATIVWLVEAAFAPIVRLFPAVDAVVAVPCESVLTWMARVLGRDRLELFHFSGSTCPLCLFPTAQRPKDSSVTLANYYGSGRTLLDAFAQAAGIAPRLRQPELLPAAPRRFVGAAVPSRPYCVIHPGPTEPRREWSLRHWRELVRRLIDDLDCDVVQLGDHPLVLGAAARLHDWTGRLDPSELVAIVDGARLFLGIDSGLAHVANARRVPGVQVVGPLLGLAEYSIHAGYYSTPGALTLLRGATSPDDVAVDDVLAAARTALSAPNAAGRPSRMPLNGAARED